MLRLTHPSIPCSAANASFRVGSMRASFEGKGTSDEARSQGRRTERVSNANFDLRVGARVPSSVRVRVLPREIVEVVPQFRGFKYVLVGDEVVILDPYTLEIVAIIPA